MPSGGFSWGGFFARLAGAVLLVYATYNPERFSFFHWIFEPKAGESGVAGLVHGFTPLKAFAGLGLVAVWGVFLQATRRSLGAGGALLVIGLFACTIWAMKYYGVIAPTTPTGWRSPRKRCSADGTTALGSGADFQLPLRSDIVVRCSRCFSLPQLRALCRVTSKKSKLPAQSLLM